MLAGTSAVMDFQNGQLYEAQYVITHPKFSQLDNDIGLIKVNRTMEFSLNLQLTPISRTWYIPTDSVARVSGWGLTNMVNFFIEFPKFLIKSMNRSCENSFLSLHGFEKINF